MNGKIAAVAATNLQGQMFKRANFFKTQMTAHVATVVYSSVIVSGLVRVLYHDRAKKSWFFNRLLAKHADPSWVFEPGCPLLDQIIRQRIEVLTGKHSSELRH